LHLVEREILDLPQATILGMGENILVSKLTEGFRIEPLMLDVAHVSRSEPLEVEENLDYQRPTWEPHRTVIRHVVDFYIPYSGDSALLDLRPGRFTFSPPTVLTDRGIVGFEIPVDVTSTDSRRLAREKDAAIEDLSQWASWSTEDVEAFNRMLPVRIRGWLQNRRQKLHTLYGLVDSLNVPLRRLDGVKPTFAVPITRKPVLLAKSRADDSYVREPSISDDIYVDILHTLDQFGRVFERYPTTFSGMDEEDLRNVILWGLTPLYGIDGSVTGETFNKKGKTDILIRYQNQNPFVAECKLWDGPKAYLATIDQLLEYLTWRDSKSAILLFVQAKGFTDVIDKTTPSHPLWVATLRKQSETWLNYSIRLKDDIAREAKLAVLLFHLSPGM
jgi:hypothetical protein